MAFAIVAVSLRISSTLADTAVLTPIKDNTLYAESGALSNGAGQAFFTGRNGVGSIRRAVLAFDLTAIPAGSWIHAATLRLTVNATPGGAQMVRLHRLIADWGEGSSAAPGGEGAGAAATTGDATWTSRFFPSASWTSAGGDYVAIASADIRVDTVGVYDWSSTGMVADVQDWLDQRATNFGWILTGGEGPPLATSKRYASRHDVDPSQRPKLIVTYCPDTCAGRVPDGMTLERGEGDALTLSWNASCAASDSDYEIYEGAMGDFASHLPIACSTSGRTTWTLTSTAGDRYYVVVPRNATREGSYGGRSDGTERPPSSSACLIQSIAPCGSSMEYRK